MLNRNKLIPAFEAITNTAATDWDKGITAAFGVWKDSLWRVEGCVYDVFTRGDISTREDAKSFVDALVKAGEDSVCLAEGCGNMCERIAYLCEAGCTVTGPAQVKMYEDSQTMSYAMRLELPKR